MKRIFLISAAFVLTGCAGIPTSAPIKYGPEINSVQTDQFIQVIGRPPYVGMTQEQIIRGFLSALADSRDNYAIAKQYLSQDAVETWQSSAGITLYDFATLEVTVDDSVATVNMAKTAEVNEIGYLTISPNGTKVNQSFELVQNDQGEWRISKLADGVLLTTGDVERSFKGYPVYFLSADRRTLVTETVLLPRNLTGSATALVQALLEGPSNKLKVATATSFPTGTKLTYGSVPISEGVANIDLTNQILSANQQTRSQMSAQLAWTLSSVPNVNSISITVSGQPISIAGVAETQTVQDWPLFNPAQYTGNEILHFVRDNQVISYNLNGEETLVVQVNPNSRININDAYGSPQGGSIAAVSTDNKRVLLSTGRGGQFELVATGEAVSKPSWDKSGSLFYSDYGVGIFEVTVNREIRPVTFSLNNIASATQVKQLAIANDGVRVAMVISDGSTDLLVGGAIVKTQTSTQIIGLHLIERNISLIKDLAWQTPTSIAVLGSDASGGNLVMDVDISNGTHTSTAAPVSAQSISSSIGKQIYVGTISDGKSTIARQIGANWSDVTLGSSPFFAN